MNDAGSLRTLPFLSEAWRQQAVDHLRATVPEAIGITTSVGIVVRDEDGVDHGSMITVTHGRPDSWVELHSEAVLETADFTVLTTYDTIVQTVLLGTLTSVEAIASGQSAVVGALARAAAIFGLLESPAWREPLLAIEATTAFTRLEDVRDLRS